MTDNQIQLIITKATPRWRTVLHTIADDMRHDIDEDVIDRLWVPKLEPFPDELICKALMRGRWKIFPNINEVLEQIDMIREEEQHERANRDWKKFQEQQKFAADNGLLATDEDYAKMNEEIRKAVGIAPAKDKPKIYYPSTKAPSKEELNRRKEEQLKALYEKYGKAK